MAAIKEMCIITRYYNNETSKVESRFLGLIEVPQANAETLFQSLTNRFEQFNVPFTNIIGYAADGANTMMGCNSSVKNRMEAANPSIFVMRCTCHSAHLAASYACATLPNETDVREVFTYFSHSAKRLFEFQQFQYFTETKPHKLLQAPLFINALVAFLNNDKRLLNSSSIKVMKQQVYHFIYKLGKFMVI